jgi:drug/metabolite transporter (DMT)-like permease
VTDAPTTNAASRAWAGALLVVTASVSFGFMPLFQRMVTAADPNVSTAMLLMLRFALASAVLLCVIVWRRLPMPRGRVLGWYVLMGAVGYFGEAYCYFGALRFLPGGLVSLLLYLYPTFVTLASWWWLGARPTGRTIAAVAVGTVGMALTIVPSIGHVEGDASGRGIGLVLGVGTAVIYAAYVIAGAAISRRWQGPLQGAFIVMASAAAMFAGVAIASGDPLPSTAGAWTGVVALAILCSVVAITCLLAGLAILGPVKTSALSLVEPLATVLVGATLLGERLGWPAGLGGAFILGGAALSIVPPKVAPKGVPKAAIDHS